MKTGDSDLWAASDIPGKGQKRSRMAKHFWPFPGMLLLGLLLTLPLALPLALATPVLAQTPEKQREFVYGANLYTGQSYEGTFYPLQVDTFYLLADVTNVLSPRESLVYYWPITNDYQVDWDGLNEVVPGTLEIWQGATLVQNLEQTDYVIQYPRGLDAGEVYLYTGAEATAQYLEFDRQRKLYRDAVAAFHAADQKYRDELAAKAKAGQLSGTPPPPPEEPAPFTFFSTALYTGFPLILAAGQYRIRLRGADGQVVPHSERWIVAFNHAREGVSYTLVPHDKYTIPEESHDPSQVLYTRVGSIVYLQPYTEKEYVDLYLTRLVQPQSTTGNQDLWKWSPRDPINDGVLEVVQGDQVVERVELHHYVVRQQSGGARGYEIIDQSTTADRRLRRRAPDFSGHRLEMKPEYDSVQIRLVDAAGQVIPGSTRMVKLVKAQSSANAALLFLPTLPLWVALGVAGWRRTRLVRLPKGMTG